MARNRCGFARKNKQEQPIRIEIPTGTAIARRNRLCSTCTRRSFSGVGLPATVAVQSPHLKMSSWRKYKSGLKKERHVPWKKPPQSSRTFGFLFYSDPLP